MAARRHLRLLALGFTLSSALFSGLAAQPSPAQQPPADSTTKPQQTLPAAKPAPHAKPKRTSPGTTQPRGKAAAKPRGGLRIGGAPVGQIREQVKEKNAAERPNLNRTRDTQYYRIAVARPDSSLISLNYYPALPGENPPVVLLVHEKDRTSRDFADKIEEFKDPNGLAAALQNEGFAVVSLDVAGLTDVQKRGTVPAKDQPAKAAARPADAKSSANQVQQAVIDMRQTYQFLVDRHNRQEFNLGKLTILTLGEGANAALEWLREATQPASMVPGRPDIKVNPADPRLKNTGRAIASGMMDTATARPSDVSALILISPVDSWNSVKTTTTLKTLLEGSPINVLAIGGTNDKASADTLKALKPVVERRESRLSKVELLDTSLHGARFLRFEPGLVQKLNRFLEQTVEYQPTEWEPRYNLTPVAYQLKEAVSKSVAQADARKAAPAEKPAAEKAKAKTEEKPPAPAPEAKPAEKPKTEQPKAEPAKETAKPAAIGEPKLTEPKN